MQLNFKKSYKFAFKSASYITLFFLGVFVLYHFFIAPLQLVFVFGFAFCLFLFSFLLIQYRVETFIYKRVKKIYDDVSLLENTSFRNQPITTDMATLTKEVQKFARDKKLEIETLKIREEYRREFLGNVSHELKTPLFTVQGYLLTLLDGAMDDKSIRKKYLQRAEKGVERLIYIVKDLDMITKLETGDIHLDLSRFNIVEVIQNVFDLLEMKAAKKNITLTFDTKYAKPIWTLGDREKIQQVVTNLVVNSIKYGKEGGTTEVGIEDLIDNKIIVRITDNGEGIEKQHISRLFERFYRVDKSGARSEGGSGLGLAIVKHIIEGHNEKIYIESQFGVGSEFSFTMEKAK
ncbi:cell wall metabolism sensor histidine kinase WalK [Flavobacterium cucumis]|uniref:histidine kinase n=1 Tax=Flavobacterium cucumis TaxID=416016 RepID=A0A1M7ZTL2_9FLAO|nr:ATP-binding protein [Flavobacterium cucumis]SHO72188.1 two-component system, OmpR family, phosphate regulon sensor histidine kinase PhoR [Flavobacterium cucumis]